jgi:hypothetical protein
MCCPLSVGQDGVRPAAKLPSPPGVQEKKKVAGEARSSDGPALESADSAGRACGESGN